MSIAKLLNSIFYKNVKYYKHFISLGYNCENAYRFFQKYHFVESSLFTWTNSINIKNIDIIMSENPEKAGFMWKDISTDIRFHGTEPHDMNIHSELYKDEDFEPFQKELKSRINHLKCKFKQQICDNTKTLFTYTYLPTNETGEEVKDNIISLHKALKNICTNPFDLLCILEEKDKIENILYFTENNIYIRYVSSFAPEDNVTTKTYDKKSWDKIFREFKADFKLQKTKKFKFEEV